MQIGDRIYTPRFCTVTIKAIYEDRNEAWKDGYKEPTHYDKDAEYDICGKPLDMYHMSFAAVRKRQD